MAQAGRAQDSTAIDTIPARLLDEVIVTGFEQYVRHANARTAVRVVKTAELQLNNNTSLVHAFNTVAGVRMEERSPGSYRINMRGSTLRSPFGVRNVKVYWNEIPFTDPGGNTYFNQVSLNNISSIQLFKGPAASMYGSGTGGAMLVETLETGQWQQGFATEYSAGSYGLQQLFVTLKLGGASGRSKLTYAHTEQDGYRQQSAMRRDNLSWSSLFKLNEKQELRASLLFTDLYYQTPGGLTKAEFDANPKSARPAAGGFPGAVQAQAAIYQKNLLAGVQHRYKIDTHWSNATALYVAYAQVKNPAVRNYERRSEPHTGGRTVFTRQQKQGAASLRFVAGGEAQFAFFNTSVFNNRQGNPDTLQTTDDIRYNTYTAFAQADIEWAAKWFITAGTSVNNTRVTFTRLNKYPVTEQSRTYRQEWAPRLSLLRKIGRDVSLLGIVSKGFSPPTIAELLPSTGVISTQLEAESGWNYELLLRHNIGFGKNYFSTEASVYYFKLNNTLVQRRDASGADFFINAGNTKQKGIEIAPSFSSIFAHKSFFDMLSIRSAYTYSHFRYGSFAKDTSNFSGKTLPSVPAHTFSAYIDLTAKNGLYTLLSYYYASRIFLNDANTASAEPYTLLGGRIGWQANFQKRFRVNFYAGADNLLDEVYSLGNDINDARGRYYNAAPRRNYYAGISLQAAK